MSESKEQPTKRQYKRVKAVLTQEQKEERRKGYYLKYKANLGDDFQQQKRELKKMHLEAGTYKCNICDKKFATSDALKDHKLTKYHLKIEEMYNRLLDIQKTTVDKENV